MASAVAIGHATAAAAAPLAVPLALAESAGVARRAWPATASVPLPRGRVTDPGRLWVAAPDGRPTRSQVDALERWPDGSVRWALVELVADVPPNATRTYTLRDTPPPRPAPGPRVRTTAGPGGIRIDTGALTAETTNRPDAILDRIALTSGAGFGPTIGPQLALGSTGAATPPDGAEVRVETQGPVRTEILRTARHRAGVAHEVRLAFFAGQAIVRVQHTITHVGDPAWLDIRSLAFALPGSFRRGALGVGAADRSFAALVGAHELRQGDAPPASVDGTALEGAGAGWARAGTDGVAVTIVPRWLLEEYPKALVVADDRVRLDLLPDVGGPTRLGVGAAKTHEFWIALEPGTGSPAASLARSLRAPLVASVPASWVVATGAVPQAITPASPVSKAFLATLTAALERYRARAQFERWDDGPPVPCAERTRERVRTGFYGALNWGDWNFPGYRDQTKGCDAWGNLEYDLPQVAALGWLATGNRLYLDVLLSAARHYRDVDIVHHAPGHPEWVGMNHPHKVLHFAKEAPQTVDLGHTWVEGLLAHWRVTGERRSLEAARGIAEVLAAKLSKANNPRQFGWPMLALVAVADATGERRFLDAAGTFAAAAIARLDPTPAAGDWKMGILADGLAAVHAATGDSTVRAWLERYAESLLAEPGRWPDARYALPLGYLARLSGDRRPAEFARATVERLDLGTWGKTIAAVGRIGFRLLGPLEAAPRPAPTPAPAAPPRPSERGPRRR